MDFLTTSSPNEVRFCCSACSDTKFHLYINVAKKAGLCFRCGRSLSRQEVKEYLKNYWSSPYVTEAVEEEVPQEESLPGIPIEELSKEQLSETLSKFGKAKLQKAPLLKYKLRVTPTSLVIPVYENGKYLGYSQRNLTKPKYKHSKNFKTHQYVYNVKPCKKIVLVEGPFDAIWVEYCTKQNAGALFGHFVGRDQVLCLMRHGIKEAVLMLDGDVSIRETLKAAHTLEIALKVLIARLPKEKDPYDCSEAEVLQALSQAVDIDSFGFRTVLWR